MRRGLFVVVLCVSTTLSTSTGAWATVPNPMQEGGRFPVIRTAGNPVSTDPADDMDAYFTLGEWINDEAANATIVAYRYWQGTWTKVPLQIDDRTVRNACTYYGPLGNPCNEAGLHACELTYVWSGETDPDGAGTLDANDELALMAFEAGERAPATSYPADALRLVDRFEVRLARGALIGWIYLFRIQGNGPAYSPADAYISATAELRPFAGDCKGDPDCPGTPVPHPVLDDWTTWEGRSEHPSLSMFPTFRVAQQSNWTLRDLWIRAPGQPTWSGSIDVLDTTRWRGAGEVDHTWNASSRRMGILTGVVRSTRGSVGAASGIGTTRYLRVYPTLLEEEVHLRVHPINRINFWADYLAAAGGASSSVYRQPELFIDDVDGTDYPDSSPDTEPPFLTATTVQTHVQTNLPTTGAVVAAVGSDVSGHITTCQRYQDETAVGAPFAVQTTLAYRDDVQIDQTEPHLGIAGEPARPLESQAGAYGNLGETWNCQGFHQPPPGAGQIDALRDSYNRTCADRIYHGLRVHTAFDTVGSGTSLSSQLGSYLVENPMEVDLRYQPIQSRVLGSSNQSRIEFGPAAKLDRLAQFTVCSWFAPNQLFPPHAVFSKGTRFHAGIGSGPPFSQYWAFVSASGAGATGAVSQANAPVATNQWQFVCFTYDDGGDRELHIWVDGVETSYLYHSPTIGSLVSDAGTPFIVGGQYFSFESPIPARVSDVLLFDRVLSSFEMRLLRSGPHAVSMSGLRLYAAITGATPEPDLAPYLPAAPGTPYDAPVWP